VLYFTPILSKSIVIEVNGDCATVGKQVAHEHGYRYIRQVGFSVEFFVSEKVRIHLDF